MRAIDEYRRLGGRTFMDNYGGKPPQRYWLEYQGTLYEAKAILDKAHRIEHPQDQRPPGDFDANKNNVRTRLERLGFRMQNSSLGWRTDVRNCIERLQKREFTADDIYSFINELAGRHPGNKNIREAIRLMLQQLRDERYLEFVSPGHYRRTEFPDADAQLDREAEQEITRQRTLGERATRPGQQQFSATIRKNYKGQCAITGCTTSAVLQAAHIRVQKDVDDNSPQNGLLLRADIHALFDALLITLSEDGTRIEVSDALTDPSYAFLQSAIVFQAPPGLRPSPDNIRHHRERFLSPASIKAAGLSAVCGAK
jgi:hypothetical protein